MHVATSVYAPSAPVHDRITRLAGSFEKTTNNLRVLLREAVSVRVGVIEMPENLGMTDATIQFVRSLGVRNVGTDRLRLIGRGSDKRKLRYERALRGMLSKYALRRFRWESIAVYYVEILGDRISSKPVVGQSSGVGATNVLAQQYFTATLADPNTLGFTTSARQKLVRHILPAVLVLDLGHAHPAAVPRPFLKSETTVRA